MCWGWDIGSPIPSGELSPEIRARRLRCLGSKSGEGTLWGCFNSAPSPLALVGGGLTGWLAHAKVGDESQHSSKSLDGMASIVAEIWGWLHTTTSISPSRRWNDGDSISFLSDRIIYGFLPSFSKLLGHEAQWGCVGQFRPL